MQGQAFNSIDQASAAAQCLQKFPVWLPAMLRVWRVSGEELAAIPVEELGDVRSLKRRLRAKHGIPACTQQLLQGGERLLDDGIVQQLPVPTDLQLVLSPVQEVSIFDADAELPEAVAEGHVEAVRWLLQAGVHTNTKDRRHRTALNLASCHGYVEIVKLILEDGALTRLVDDDGKAPLHNASLWNRLEIVRLLLQGGAAKDATDNHNRTALHLAANSGHVDIVRVLLEAGAAMDLKDRQGRTALMLAAREGNEDAAFVLLQAGANKELRDAFGQTAFMLAFSAGFSLWQPAEERT